MNITREQAASLGRRRQQPVKAPGDLIAIFVAGTLVNPLNASAWGWRKRSRLAKQWKERVSLVLLESGWQLGVPQFQREPRPSGSQYVWAATPKAVTFHAHTHNAMDDDGLMASLKPCRDALVECGVISGDAPKDGHSFSYSQQINRAHRGVEIRVRLR